ncbi:hypothetical protein D3C75_702110 [compost metagenome]
MISLFIDKLRFNLTFGNYRNRCNPGLKRIRFIKLRLKDCISFSINIAIKMKLTLDIGNNSEVFKKRLCRIIFR